MLNKNTFPQTENQDFMQQYLEQSVNGFLMDVRVWENKRYEYKPVLCDGDGPLHKMRKWYSQFYLPVV